MRVLKLEQNSPEWEYFRLDKIGGSKPKDLIPLSDPTKPTLTWYLSTKSIDYTKPTPTKTDPNKRSEMNIGEMVALLTPEQRGELNAKRAKKDEFYKLVAARVARPITPNDYEDRIAEGARFSMSLRGHLLEPEAIAVFEELSGKKVDHGDVVWQDEDNPNIYVSPDGSIANKDGKYTEAVEVKCLDTHKIIRAIHENEYPQEYRFQVAQYFMVNPDLEKLYFVMYTDVMPARPITVFEVTRSEVKDVIVELRAFEESIIAQADKLADELSF